MSEPKYLVFDTETTGIDVFNDRVVQLFMATADENGEFVETWEWIINPGVDVPEEASNVHGFTTGYLKEHGETPGVALVEARDVFEGNLGLVWVAYNLNYDISILNAEFDRLGITSTFRTYTEIATLFDPLVVDRAEDKYRKGKRKLENVAAHYGVPFDPEEAHKADYDVSVTAKVAVKVADKYGIPSNKRQAEMYRTWAEGLQEYLRRTDPSANVNGDWPLRLTEESK